MSFSDGDVDRREELVITDRVVPTGRVRSVDDDTAAGGAATLIGRMPSVAS